MTAAATPTPTLPAPTEPAIVVRCVSPVAVTMTLPSATTSAMPEVSEVDVSSPMKARVLTPRTEIPAEPETPTEPTPIAAATEVSVS